MKLFEGCAILGTVICICGCTDVGAENTTMSTAANDEEFVSSTGGSVAVDPSISGGSAVADKKNDGISKGTLRFLVSGTSPLPGSATFSLTGPKAKSEKDGSVDSVQKPSTSHKTDAGRGNGNPSDNHSSGKPDSSPSISDVRRILVTVSRIEVYSRDRGWLLVSDFSPTGRKTDLLATDEDGLGDFGGFVLNEGVYDQIRLILTGEASVELMAGTDLVTEPLKIPSAKNNGLKIVRGFSVADRAYTTFAVSFDPEKSLHYNKGQGWMLKPTIKLLSVTTDSADADEDGIFDVLDNCPAVSNPDQNDFDKDGIGNLCDNDTGALSFSFPPEPNSTLPVEIRLSYQLGLQANTAQVETNLMEVTNLGDNTYRIPMTDSEARAVAIDFETGMSIRDVLAAQSGGVVATAVNDVAVLFPRESLPDGRSILDMTITRTAAPLPVPGAVELGQVGAVDLRLAGDEPTKTVFLYFAFDAVALAANGISPSDLEVYCFDPAGSLWIACGGKLDSDENLIYLATSHFSLYAYGLKTDAPPAVEGLVNIFDFPNWRWPSVIPDSGDCTSGDSSASKNDFTCHSYPYARAPDGCSVPLLGNSEMPITSGIRSGTVSFRESCKGHDRCWFTLTGSRKQHFNNCNGDFLRDMQGDCYEKTKFWVPPIVLENWVITLTSPITGKKKVTVTEGHYEHDWHYEAVCNIWSTTYYQAISAYDLLPGTNFDNNQAWQKNYQAWLGHLTRPPACQISGTPDALTLQITSAEGSYKEYPYFSLVTGGGISWAPTSSRAFFSGSMYVPGTYTSLVRNEQTGATNICPVIISPNIIPPVAPMYRFLATQGFFMDHFLTASMAEGTNAGFTFETIAFYFFTQPLVGLANVPIYRCFNPHVGIGDHFVSNSSDCEGYTFEGLYGWVSAAAIPGVADVPIYRCMQVQGLDHLTTSNPQECVVAGYAVEGPQGYVPY